MSIVLFRLSQLLDKIRNEEKREKEKKTWEEHFVRWGLNPNAEIVFEDNALRKIITSEGEDEESSARLLVQWADRLGAILEARDLSSSQIRNFFGEVRSIEQTGFSNPKARRRFILLIPKIEYAVAKGKGGGIKDLKEVLVRAIKLVQDSEENFKRFVQFFEAILAYHKAYGGN